MSTESTRITVKKSTSSTRARVKKSDALLPAIIEGISPEVTLTSVEAGVRMDVTTKSGTKTALIPKGEPGEDYELKPEDIQEIGGMFNDIKEAAEDARDEAAGYAASAGQSASSASNLAATASAQATLAGQAKTGAETAQGAAEVAQEAAEAAQEAAEEARDDVQGIYESAAQAITRVAVLEQQATQAKEDAEDAADSAKDTFYLADKARAEAQVANDSFASVYQVSETETDSVSAPNMSYIDSAGSRFNHFGNAAGYASKAQHEAGIAVARAGAAATSAEQAAQSATAAGQSATAAAGSAADAAQSAQDAEETVADVTEELALVKSALQELESDVEDKLDSPSTAGTNGQVLTSDGQGGQTWETPVVPEIPVQDVQINGTSILSDGVANIPRATGSTQGVCSVGNGINVTDGKISALMASSSEVKAGSAQWRSINPYRQHESAFYGLAKAAGANMASIASTTVGVYPEEQKSAIHEMLNGSVAVSGTTPSITALPGVRYVCGEVSTLDITLPASGIVDVTFQSGATATVLTITPPTGITLRWIGADDVTALEANKTYEINIKDGLGMVVSWT